jgi:hypothetical protein
MIQKRLNHHGVQVMRKTGILSAILFMFMAALLPLDLSAQWTLMDRSIPRNKDGVPVGGRYIGGRNLWVQPQGRLDQVGHPSTEALRTTERFRRLDFGHVEVQATIDDPKAYRKPWTFTQPLRLMVDTDLLELICNENNKDLPHLKGK